MTDAEFKTFRVKTFRVITSITSFPAGQNFRRAETDYQKLEEAYKFATRWFEEEYDSAQKGFTVSVSIIPMRQLEDLPF